MLEWPRGRELSRSDLPGWLALLSELVALRGATTLSEVASDAVRDPDSPDRMYKLGY
ncbi:hypothetical protein BH11MYX3_BH11MYX3_43050 [soil metagenome]